MAVETEIKLPVRDLESSRAAIEREYPVRHARTHEANVLFDSRTRRLRRKGCLVRVRQFGGDGVLTFKGRGAAGRHKQREEIELRISSSEAMSEILEKLGLAPVFRYEKFRTEYAKPNEEGVITFDETPIGNFLELEGPSEWIDRVAAQLGYAESDYITASYAGLYDDYRQRTGTSARDMLFEPKVNIGHI